MALITFSEIIAMLLVTLVIGFIFKDMFKIHKHLDIIHQYKKSSLFEGLLFASLVTAPGIILHELAHKFIAMALGYSAIFKAWLPGLGLALLLKLINSPFLLIAPGYVQIASQTPTQDLILIAFAGPFINLILWITSVILLKKRKFSEKYTIALYATKRINMILFIFNMLPLPFFDGSKVWLGLYHLLTSA